MDILEKLRKEEAMYMEYIKFHNDQEYNNPDRYRNNVQGHINNLSKVRKEIKEIERERRGYK